MTTNTKKSNRVMRQAVVVFVFRLPPFLPSRPEPHCESPALSFSGLPCASEDEHLPIYFLYIKFSKSALNVATRSCSSWYRSMLLLLSIITLVGCRLLSNIGQSNHSFYRMQIFLSMKSEIPTNSLSSCVDYIRISPVRYAIDLEKSKRIGVFLQNHNHALKRL